MKKILSVILCVALMMATMPISFTAAVAEEKNGVGYVLDEIIIKFFDRSLFPGKEKQYDDEVAKVLRDGLSVVTDNVYVVAAEDFVRNPNATLNRFKNSKFIEYVEPNYTAEFDATTNDPGYKNLTTALTALGAQTGWDIINSGGPVVAVVDSGVAQHSDLPKMLPGFSAVSSLSPNNDKRIHGTGVAGVIGAIGNNGVGTVGINWNATLLPVKVDDANGTLNVANVAKGIIWAADNGADIINLSLSFTSDSATLKSAIDYAFGKGCAIFGSTGNDGKNTINYPARYANVMAVGATLDGIKLASDSNYGSGIGVVALSAYYTTNASGGYANFFGTSAAAPQVAGLASLILALNPNLTNEQVYDLIQRGASNSTKYNTTLGYGFINIGNTLSIALAESTPPAVDATAPELTLKGEQVMEIEQGARFTDPGYTAIDDVDGDITNKVVVTGSVNVNVPGVYRLEYSVSDAAGNKSTATRVVEVVQVVYDPPVLTLNGAQKVQITQGDMFKEPGYTATDKIDGNLTNRVSVTGTVDNNKPGSYSLQYRVVNSKDLSASATRTVEVIAKPEPPKPEPPKPEPTPEPEPVKQPDPEPEPAPQYKTPPVITLNGSMEVGIYTDEEFTEPGYRAVDCLGADLTGAVKVAGNVKSNAKGIYTITYTVTDAGGNTARATRTVIVAEREAPLPPPSAPTVTIVGSNPIILHIGSNTPYTEQGATALDLADGDISKNVRISGSVNRNVAGTYKLTYTVTNKAGLSASATRDVRILAGTETKLARTPYSFSGQGKVPTATTHTGVVVEKAGWMDFNATSVDNKSAITVSVVNARTGTAVFNNKFTAKGGLQFWADAGTYNVTVTLVEGNGNCKYGVSLLTPEEIYTTFADAEVPLGFPIDLFILHMDYNMKMLVDEDLPYTKQDMYDCMEENGYTDEQMIEFGFTAEELSGFRAQ